MIALENLSKYFPTRFGRHYVCRNINIKLADHDNVALLGKNGSGKTTFINMLGGIDLPNSGRIVSNERISWPVGLASGFQGALTGYQNARFVCRIYGESDAEIREKVEYVHQFSEIGDYFHMPVNTYSSGMRARLAFGLSLIFDFDTLLMDEVTAVGDPSFRQKAVTEIESRKAKCRIISASHNLGELRQICNVAIVLSNGNAQAYNSVDEAIVQYAGEETLERLTRPETLKKRQAQIQAEREKRQEARLKKQAERQLHQEAREKRQAEREKRKAEKAKREKEKNS